MKFGLFALGMISLMLIAACSTPGSAKRLSGRSWVLSRLKDQPPITGTTITANFDQNGEVSGSSGCNSYRTTYEVKNRQLTFDQAIASTLMACPEPNMEQERNFFEILTNTTSFEITNDELILIDAHGGELARFDAVDQTLDGSTWQAISYNNGKGGIVSLIIGTIITADFGLGGRLTGNAGCNDYFTEYQTDGRAISIGTVGATRKFCGEPEGIMQQEQQYLAALEKANTFMTNWITLEIRSSEGALVAKFRRVAAL
ncbi:MAG: META domain-containing protein [Chloroflexota bacterium]|nr:MAG: META domain-containing protein [Chloroflexota bacterium]